MYGGLGATRIYNSRPDPLENGPPKRILREENNIGEIVPASKKRISWRFTLGESDTQHEIVLTHSIMSYKKIVEYDGRQMHFSSTATPGDWHFTMILDGPNYVFEVRINDLESHDVPKYDLAIDRVPFRRWDVYRRKKQPITTATYAQPNAPPANTYGAHRWGPGGVSAPQPQNGQYGASGQRVRRGSGSSNRSPTERRSSSFGGSQRDDQQRYSYNDGQRNSFTGDGSRSSFTGDDQRNSYTEGQRNSFTGQSYQQQQWGAPMRQQHGPPQQQQYQHQHQQQQQQPALTAASARSSTTPAVVKQPQKEINLIDDFGPSVSVSAQSLLFDPLASSKISAPAVPATSTAPQQQMAGQSANPHTVNSPPMAPGYGVAAQTNATSVPYVDPFAAVAPAAPLKPAPAPINLDPFASQTSAYTQPQRQMAAVSQSNTAGYPQSGTTGFQVNQPVAAAPVAGVAAPQAMRMGGMHAPVVGGGGMYNANYNISQLMNPVDVNNVNQQSQPAKTINIDPFAGMK